MVTLFVLTVNYPIIVQYLNWIKIFLYFVIKQKCFLKDFQNIIIVNTHFFLNYELNFKIVFNGNFKQNGNKYIKK